MRNTDRLLRAATAAALLLLVSGCLVVGGAAVVGGAIVAADRRSVGIQLEDEAIERRLNRAIYGRYKDGEISVYVTSYNRKVLLAGQVVTEAIRAEVAETAARGENVREVANELEVRALSPATVRNNDIAITGKVRAAFVESKEVEAGVVKTTTERGIVYLLGRVTEDEGAAAAKVASRVSGVNKVVKVFDYMTADELAAYKLNQPAPPAQRK